MDRIARTFRPLGRCLFVGTSLALFARALRGADLSTVSRLFSERGPWLVAAVVPFAVAQALDAEAWRLVLARVARPVRLGELYPVRVAIEALTSSLPAGVVVAESVAPRLLGRLGIPPGASLPAAAARRWLTMRAHAIYVALGAAAALVGIGRSHPGDALAYAPLIVLASATLPLGASLALSLTLGTGSRVAGLYGLLARLPAPAVRRWLASRRATFAATDAGLSSLARGGSLVRPTVLLVGAWLLESVEAWTLLRLVGARLSFVEVLSFEAGLSVLRSAWFFAPAGLGGLDLGYLAVFHALGVPDAAGVGGAFLVLKRGRELLWACLGYAWLAARRAGNAIESAPRPRLTA